ncbi:MAG: WYL domain-containing protein [Nitriliruptor sp.]|nr:MAG: WYL domain-containing protein [Nitriliruptor sp.]
MSAAADVARMLTMVPWLLERPGASLAEIAEAFGVSESRVRADLGHLDFCGLPGLGGGDLFEVGIVGDRVLLRMADELKRPLRPTPREALRLVVTVDAVAEALGEELPTLRSAVDRIRAALDIPERSADVLEPDGVRTLPLLRRAVREHRQVVLEYQGRADATPAPRVVDPWALHVLDGTWYLQGHDHGVGDRRVFRLDRVAAARLTDTEATVSAPSHLDPPRYVPGPDDVAVVLTLSPRGRWVQDAVTADEVVEQPDGGATLHLRTDALGFVAQLVLMAAGEAVVEEPGELRELVRQRAEQALQRAAGPS